MFIVNFQSRVPVYQQIYDNVIRLVSMGIICPNEKLPAVRRLATDLGVNPNTVAKAYQMLESNGYIYTVTGKGSFVSEKLQMADAERMEMKSMILEDFKKAQGLGLSEEEIIILLNQVYKGGVNND